MAEWDYIDKIGYQLGELDLMVELAIIREETAKPMTRDDLRLLHERMCEEARQLMKAKNMDYATEQDIFRNFRMFGALGILVRMSDKLARLRSVTENGGTMVKDESLRDTLLDLINYAVIFEGYIKSTGETKNDTH